MNKEKEQTQQMKLELIRKRIVCRALKFTLQSLSLSVLHERSDTKVTHKHIV